MDINRNNYEHFLIDYIDGSLTANQLKAVEAFLLLNPDIKTEFESLSNHVLLPEEQAYKNKAILKKTDYSATGVENEFDYLCIASLEDDITEEEEAKLQSIINSSKSREKDYRSFINTKLLPNEAIVYQQKSKLKRVTLIGYSQKQIISFSSAVAVALLLVTLFNYNINLSKVEQNQPNVHDIVKPAAESGVMSLDGNEDFEVQSYTGHKRAENFEVNERLIPAKQEFTTDKIAVIEPEHNRADYSLAYLKPIAAHTIKVDNDLSNTAYSLYANLPSKELLGSAKQIQQVTNTTIGLFELAQLGITRLANATGARLSLLGEKDETGELKRVQIETGLFALSLPVNRKE